MSASHRNFFRSSRAFTIVPLALVLWIALIILGVLLYLKAPPPGYAPVKGVGPGQIGSIILAVVYGGFWFVMLSPVAEKKGRTWANIGAVITLGFAGFMLTLSYFGLSADQRSLAKNTASSTPGVPPVTSSAPAPKSMGDAMRDAAEKNRQAAEAAILSHQQALQRQREAAARTMDAISRGETPAPATPDPAAAPASSTPRTSAPEDPQAAIIKSTLAGFAGELDAQADEAGATVKVELDAITKPPRQDIREIKARIEKLATAREKLSTLKAAMDRAGNGAADALVAAGVDQAKARAESAVWSARAGIASRSFAADRLIDTIDKGLEEATLLRDNLGKWKLDKAGEVTSKDFKLQSSIRSARFFVTSGVSRAPGEIDNLRGR